MHFALRIHRLINVGVSIDDDDDEGPGDDDDLPPLVEVEGATEEASKMEELDSAVGEYSVPDGRRPATAEA